MSSPRPFFLLSLFRSLPTGFFYALLLPTESQAFTAISSPDREQTENGKISIFWCVLHRSSQNSLFCQVAGPFQEIISQPHREQHFTETHRKITEISLFFLHSLFSDLNFYPLEKCNSEFAIFAATR